MSVLAQDRIPISGREGVVTAEIDGKQVTLAEIKSVKANIEFNKVEYRVMGSGATRHKYAGWNGTGSLVYHWLSPRFVKMIIDGANSGVPPYFSLTITNDDPVSASNEAQTVTLGQVLVDGGDVAVIDVENDLLEGSVNFTFSEVEGLNYFAAIEEEKKK